MSKNFLTARTMFPLKESAEKIQKFKQRMNAKFNHHEHPETRLRFFGSHSPGSRPSLIVSSGPSAFIFNPVEGVQRTLHNFKVKMLSVENLFTTRRDFETALGAASITICNHDEGALRMSLYEPRKDGKFFTLLSTICTFVTPIELKSAAALGTLYEDDLIRIESVSIDPNESTAKTKNQEQISKRVKTDFDLAAYSCTLAATPGHLDPTKCRDLGVPVGPLLGKLKSGHDITLPDGKVILSKDVMSNPSPRVDFLIVDCPSADYIGHFSKSLEAYRVSLLSKARKEVDLVVHLSDISVIDHKSYQNLLGLFGAGCQHYYLSGQDRYFSVYPSSAQLQYLLNKLDPVLFPLTSSSFDLSENSQGGDDGDPLEPDQTIERLNESVVNLPDEGKSTSTVGNLIPMRALDTLVIKEGRSIELNEDELNIEEKYNNLLKNQYEDKMRTLKEAQQKMRTAEKHEPEIVFLGTCSSKPSKYRNVSCILVNFTEPQNFSVILDCGEDSKGQLIRYYGQKGADEVLKRLRIIYISHMHADHNLGLISLLKSRRKLTEKPVAILVPPEVESFLRIHNACYEDLSDTYVLFSTQSELQKSFNHTTASFLNGPIRSLSEVTGGLVGNITLVEVMHCRHSKAIVLEFELNHPKMKVFKLAYSGDARPSLRFAELGRNCDLLIHEATFSPCEVKDAILKSHSTTREAISVGREMNSKFTILTHFSAKYNKAPLFNDEFDDKVGFAFDYMKVRVPSELSRIPPLRHILEDIFNKEFDELKMKVKKHS